MQKNALYYVFDGVDGSGKGTQIELLKKRLAEEDVEVFFTREPGGTLYGQSIREVLLSPEGKDADAYTQFLLFWADRNEHMEKVVIPNLTEGRNVFSDRGDSSTFAFQMYGEESLQLEGEFFHQRSKVFGAFAPDYYFILDLPPEEAYKRMKNDKARTHTHYDLRPIEYHERVREGFAQFAKRFSCEIIDANRSAEEIHEDLWTSLKNSPLLM